MDSTEHPYKLAFIAPACFYYQVPIFRDLERNKDLDLTVYFCTNEGLGKDVKIVYGSDEAWGVEDRLLEGYKSKFLRNDEQS